MASSTEQTIAELAAAMAHMASATADESAAPLPELPAALRSAYDACLRLLAARQRSRAELEEALARREVVGDDVQVVLDRIDALGLIDDAAFARACVADQQRSRGLSRRGLAAELRKRGISDADAHDALENIDDDSERATAELLVNKRLSQTGPIDRRTMERRLMGLLARRGYSAELSRSVIAAALDRS